MPTAKKAETIETTRERYERSVGVIFTEYRGLKVKQMQDLRSKLREKGGDIHVVKNTLFRIAAGEHGKDLPENIGSGPTAIAFIYENEAECAKSLVDFALTNKAFVVKGGLFGGKAFDGKQVEALSKLPPRDVLISQVIGAVISPLSSLVGTIEALYADPIRVIGAVADKVAEGSGPVETETASSAPAVEEPASTEPSPAAEESAAPTDSEPSA
jgi:large subunit ribosomal protein L10